MIKRFLRPPRSLDGKMLYMILLSLLCASLVYFGVYSLGSWALNEIYMSPESRSARQAEIYSDFFEYVTDRQISGDNSEAVARWTQNHPYVTILVYKDDTLNMRASRGQAQYAGQPGITERLQYSSLYGRLYPLRFADGVYLIAISDSSNVREDNINRLLAVLLGSVAFISIMFWYIRRLTNRIIRLSREAEVIGSGDLEASITVKGEDELATLAVEMDAMRNAVIERMSGEKKAWEANTELITAISHDIRTPMTALIGYLGLLNEGDFSDRDKSKAFSASAYGKAMELKDLTDELFRYFLVFGHGKPELKMEDFDARLLLDQLLGEAEFDLVDAGFHVKRHDFEGECQLHTDPLYLKRVVDNLVSNAKKYADPEQPIRIDLVRKNDKLTVRMSNTIAKNSRRAESTKIGLRTCEKILGFLNGSFSSGIDNDIFSAVFTLPIEFRT